MGIVPLPFLFLLLCTPSYGNLIDVPVQCPEGQFLGPQGKCRQIWGHSTTPNPCREGFVVDSSGNCVENWSFLDLIVSKNSCPPGKKLNSEGICIPNFNLFFSIIKFLGGGG